MADLRVSTELHACMPLNDTSRYNIAIFEFCCIIKALQQLLSLINT